jgi:hypothetical protein
MRRRAQNRRSIAYHSPPVPTPVGQHDRWVTRGRYVRPNEVGAIDQQPPPETRLTIHPFPPNHLHTSILLIIHASLTLGRCSSALTHGRGRRPAVMGHHQLENPLVPGMAPTATRLLAVGGDTTKLGLLVTNLRLRGYQGMHYSPTAS